MKNIRKKYTERRNVIRSRRQERIYPFLERLVEDRLTQFFEAFLYSLDKRVGAVLDRLDDLEGVQMDLVKIQSGLTKKLFPDYVPEREKVSKGYHENYLN